METCDVSASFLSLGPGRNDPSLACGRRRPTWEWYRTGLPRLVETDYCMSSGNSQSELAAPAREPSPMELGSKRRNQAEREAYFAVILPEECSEESGNEGAGTRV